MKPLWRERSNFPGRKGQISVEGQTSVEGGVKRLWSEGSNVCGGKGQTFVEGRFKRTWRRG